MNFAIVEDNASNCQELKQCLKTWEQEHFLFIEYFPMQMFGNPSFEYK